MGINLMTFCRHWDSMSDFQANKLENGANVDTIFKGHLTVIKRLQGI